VEADEKIALACGVAIVLVILLVAGLSGGRGEESHDGRGLAPLIGAPSAIETSTPG
jgi:hypothetical protein